MSSGGRVFLVGAGPGAPDLLTLRAARLLESADVVVYDSLASRELLSLAPEAAERIDVGKRGHDAPTRTQADIQALLIDRARAGKRVVRLKGGDPFVFGRGGEEASACREAGIPCDVVPGVSSALAVPALAGIPLTDRRHAASFAVVTGHKDPTQVREAIRWAGLATSADTLVILMGMRNLKDLVARLLDGGRSPDTPAAAIMDGTLPSQRVVVAPLSGLADAVTEAGLVAPGVIVVGHVVRLREELGAWDRLPLFGRRILVTRPAAGGQAWAGALREAGAEPWLVPMIEIEPIVASPELDAVFAAWNEIDELLLTSANAARQLAARARERGFDPRRLAATAHCVGPATARAAREVGFAIGELPLEGFDAVALAERLLSAGDLGGRRYLLPQAEGGRDLLASTLRGAGARVDVVPVHRTVPRSFDAEAVRTALSTGGVDAAIFASPSAVRSLVQGVGRAPARAPGVRTVALGPATTEALREVAIEPDLQPGSASIDACIEALCASWGGSGGDR